MNVKKRRFEEEKSERETMRNREGNVDGERAINQNQRRENAGDNNIY